MMTASTSSFVYTKRFATTSRKYRCSVTNRLTLSSVEQLTRLSTEYLHRTLRVRTDSGSLHFGISLTQQSFLVGYKSSKLQRSYPVLAPHLVRQRGTST